MNEIDPMVLAASAPAWFGALQLVLARRRDLGPLTIGVTVAVLLAMPASSNALYGALAASLLATLAWAWGSRRGVGRPELSGVVWLAAVSSMVALALIDPGTVENLRPTLAIAVAAVGALCGIAALSRAGNGRRRTRWVGSVPIGEEPAAKA